MNKKKAGGIAAGFTAIFTAATLIFFGISGGTVIEVDFSIEQTDTAYEMSVNPPEELCADIIELYCNGEKVTATLLPQGKLKSIPFVFSDLSNLEIRFYKLGECIGIGNFKDGKLYVAVKDGVLPKGYGETENPSVSYADTSPDRGGLSGDGDADTSPYRGGIGEASENGTLASSFPTSGVTLRGQRADVGIGPYIQQEHKVMLKTKTSRRCLIGEIYCLHRPLRLEQRL